MTKKVILTLIFIYNKVFVRFKTILNACPYIIVTMRFKIMFYLIKILKDSF